MMKLLEQLSHFPKARLAFIDFSLNYFGEISRLDLINKFQSRLAAATRDFSTYKEFASGNLELVHQTKSYHLTENFKLVFVHEPEQVLSSLARVFGDGLSSLIKPKQSCIEAPLLNKPVSDILSAVMRAITQKYVLKICYVSLTSGESQRVIVPHSLVDNGNRWHIRAYDRMTSSFRDFVITRIKSAKSIGADIDFSKESISSDKQWNHIHIVGLTFISYPKGKFSEAIELDYAMVGGQLVVACRAASVGYLLNRWYVDCSSKHILDAAQYQLALLDNAVLFDVENASLAPGYQE